MKQKTFVIRNQDIISKLVAFLQEQPEKPVLEVVVKNYHKDRSLLQNSLYWVWVTVIANELGQTKKDAHYDLRKDMLVPIYERDDIGYAAMLQAVRNVHKMGLKRDAKILADEIIELTSTTDATVKQFAEYLTEIERDMIGKGIILPHKEDLYYDSLMIKPT